MHLPQPTTKREALAELNTALGQITLEDAATLVATLSDHLPSFSDPETRAYYYVYRSLMAAVAFEVNERIKPPEPMSFPGYL